MVDPKAVVSVMLTDVSKIVTENIKPDDRSPMDRHCAVFLTELEKLRAYYEFWINPEKKE